MTFSFLTFVLHPRLSLKKKPPRCLFHFQKQNVKTLYFLMMKLLLEEHEEVIFMFLYHQKTFAQSKGLDLASAQIIQRSPHQ
jgi:hypothetical protein